VLARKAVGPMVAETVKLDVLTIFGVSEENHQFEDLSDGEVDDGPQLALGSFTAHRGEGISGESGRESA
jgi:hypothetical protein